MSPNRAPRISDFPYEGFLRYFDHVLRDDEDELGVARYIVENPVRAGLVNAPGEYPLTGSSRYTFEQIAEAIADWSPYDKKRLWRG